MDFIETPNFTRRIVELLRDDEYSALQMALRRDPSHGAVIQGGGIRKVRWALPGRGKSGGVRVIYYWAVAPHVILMLDVYAKSEREDLTRNEVKILRRIVESKYP